MKSEAVYKKLIWRSGKMLCVQTEMLPMEVPGNYGMSVSVDLSDTKHKPMDGRIMERIVDCAGDNIDNLNIYNLSSNNLTDDVHIDLSKHRLKSFSLAAIPSFPSPVKDDIVQLEKYDPNILYFSIQGTSVSQELVNTVSDYPNILGILIENRPTGKSGRGSISNIPQPANKDIKLWMFCLPEAIYDIKIEDWEANALEVMMLSHIWSMKRLPTVLKYPPDTLDEVYLENCGLNDNSLMPLGEMLRGNKSKTLVLSANYRITDIPVFEGAEDVCYVADDVKFSPSTSITNERVNKRTCGYVRSIYHKIIPGTSEFVPEPLYRREILKDQTGYDKLFFLRDIIFLEEDYSSLSGVSHVQRLSNKSKFKYFCKRTP